MNDKETRHRLGRRHRWFRKWHRWIGFGAGLFLIFAATTGFLVAFTEFFGPAERLREANRKLTSDVTTSTPSATWQNPLTRAIADVEKRAPSTPIDRINIELKGAAPRIQIFTGKIGGGEDRQFTFDARTGAFTSVARYVDKPFLWRLHSGEVFGDGGLVVAMFWALALFLLGTSGIYIYLTMRRREARGLRRVFW